ncbi:MAG: UbiD family decarboxylase, partial [Dehalococcoidia bacterium]|nr:UbiD family decarboxylase [Dehalococcoidia bacterium]
MAFRDLRGWMAEVEALGQLQIARGAHWDLEIGTITELVRRQKNRPAVVFDDIPGYSSGFRVLGNIFGSVDRMALTWGLPLGLSMKELKDAVSKKYRSLEPIPPIEVSNGPIMENVMSGAEVDLFKFPVPKWHELDGGRYIGTASATITRDPEENWVNLGTYRVMVMDKNHVGFMISTGHQGRTHRDKYFARNQPMPVAISCGHDPTIFLVASREYPWGVCEYDYAGAIKGQPIEVIKGPLTGLPIPATAEIVLEGFATPGETRIEGPFGEYTGYYGSAARDEPIIEIKAVYYRNDPIILGSPPSRPPSEQTFTSAIVR